MLHRAARLFIFAHIWLGLGAFAQVYLTASLVPIQNAWVLPAMAVALATVAAYGFMRGVHISDGTAEAAHLVWFDKHRRTLWIFTALCAVASTVLLLFTVKEAWWVVLVLAPFVALYIVPATGTGWSGLRNIPLLKVFLIAAVWGGVTVVFPIAAFDVPISSTVLLLWLERSLFVVAITLTFDVRDMHFDPPGQRTIPQVLGVWPSKLVALLALASSYLLLDHALQATSVLSLDPLVMVGYFLVALLILGARPRGGAFYFNFLLDGTLVLVPCCVLLNGILRST